LERLVGNDAIEPLKVLADVVEPVKNYERGRTRQYTQLTPLNRLVDAVRPESNVARTFAALDISDQRRLLNLWAGNHEKLLPIIQQSPLLSEIELLSKKLSDVARSALALVDRKGNSQGLSESERATHRQVFDNAEKSSGALQLAVLPHIKTLFAKELYEK
jgi:hexosaminidase